MSFNAIDVSNMNGNVNMKAIRDAGYKLVILRCSEGTSGTGSKDEKYLQNYQNARDVGLLVGAYHFARFKDYAKCDTEITNFKNCLGSTKPDIVVLDMEQSLNAGIDITDLSLYFMDKVSSIAPVLFYTFSSFLKAHCNSRITKYPLWIAQYGVGAPTVTYYDSYALWQYSESGKIPAISSANLDLNYGTDAFLAQLTSGKKYVPPTPTPVNASNPTPTGKSVISNIQSVLNSRYKAGLSVDGVVGANTKKALIKGLQSELNTQYGKKLTIDGVYGAATKAALSGVIIKKGAEGNLTYLVQALLACRGWNLYPDGIFGDMTYTKIVAFQKEKKLTADGIVGANTIDALITASL